MTRDTVSTRVCEHTTNWCSIFTFRTGAIKPYIWRWTLGKCSCTVVQHLRTYTLASMLLRVSTVVKLWVVHSFTLLCGFATIKFFFFLLYHRIFHTFIITAVIIVGFIFVGFARCKNCKSYLFFYFIKIIIFYFFENFSLYCNNKCIKN